MPFDFAPMPPHLVAAIFIVLLVLALASTVMNWRAFNRPGSTSQQRERSISLWFTSAVAFVLFFFCAWGSVGVLVRGTP